MSLKFDYYSLILLNDKQQIMDWSKRGVVGKVL